MKVTEGRYKPPVKANLMVPMRDGIRLAGDLYLPAREDAVEAGPWPAILIRTPYDKEALGRDGVGQRWATHGYACFIQDCRGRYRSEGTFYKYVNEAEDGYDTVESGAQRRAGPCRTPEDAPST